MKTLYFDCGMGAAGDMLMACLLELHPDPDDVIMRLNKVLEGKAVISAGKLHRCGIVGTQVSVVIDGREELPENISAHSREAGHHHESDHGHGSDDNHEHAHHSHRHMHPHNGIHEVLALIEEIELPEKVRRDAQSVYRIIADAESKVHGTDMEHIHFHEVGSLDALADVVGVCTLIDELQIQKIVASYINVGSGKVRCAHGILPVPAPATEQILRGIPIYAGEIASELCTPTGAALIKYFVQDYGPMPLMKVEKAGYGIGHKKFETANVLRALLGQSL